MRPEKVKNKGKKEKVRNGTKHLKKSFLVEELSLIHI